mgnify:CR=1 FL=1
MAKIPRFPVFARIDEALHIGSDLLAVHDTCCYYPAPVGVMESANHISHCFSVVKRPALGIA